MRLVPALLLAACLGLPVMADDLAAAPADTQPANPGQQPGIYRFGATYEYLSTASANDCQQLCTTREACLAWTFVQALDDGASRCELKRGAGRAERNPLATSGLSARHEDLFMPPPPTDELAGGSDIASPPSDKPEPLVATDPT